MEFVDDKVKEILQRLPSECPYIDYKVIPYKENQKHDFLKDVIAMLNSEAAIGQDKFIIVGVENIKHTLVGINDSDWKDDNEWQNLLDNINPRPDVRTGTVSFEEKCFGYIYISHANEEWVYEASKTVISSKEDVVKERNILAIGQAFTRIGSRNSVLMAAGRKHLLDKKIQKMNFMMPRIVEPANTNVLYVVALLGSWNESFEGDKILIEQLAKMSFQEYTSRVRDIYEKNSDILTYPGKCWKVKKHKDLLLQEASNLYDSHVSQFFGLLKGCLDEIDPKYNLISEHWFAATILTSKEKRKYSDQLRKGMCETVAILGNHDDAFVNCTDGNIKYTIYQFEKNFFHAKDWKIYATEADNLKYLGEAYPDVFMDEIIRMLDNNDEAFLTFLAEKENGIVTNQYGYQLSWILSNIAKVEKYFSKAVSVLFYLAKINQRFLDTIVGIVLPWFPQTHASIELRTGVFRGLAAEDEDLTWKVLMKLMPGATTTGNPIQKPEYLEMEDIPEGVSTADYNKATIAYVRIAENLIGKHIDRMCSMLQVIDDVDLTLQQEILSKIKKNAVEIDVKEKALLWNAIQDFLLRHRKFADADWALSEERLLSISEYAEFLLPDTTEATNIRFFRKDQYNLFEEKGNYREQKQKLESKQIELLRSIYNLKQLNGIIEFLGQIENQMVAGKCLSNFLSDEDIRMLIGASKNVGEDSLLNGLIPRLSFERIKIIIIDCTDLIKAQILSRVSISESVLEYVDQLNEDAQEVYWTTNEIWGFQQGDTALEEKIVEKLNFYKKTDKSIAILYEMIENKENVRPKLVADTLILNVENQHVTALDEYCIQHLIQWLQNNKINNQTLILIEWKYLAFLNESGGYPPMSIWKELSNNPVFFVDILKFLYGKSTDFNGSKEEKKMAENQCYELLHGWKRVPGIEDSGIINKEQLENWVATVRSKTKDCGLEGIAMDYLGKTMFYAPKDEDGFFIDRQVAYYLQSDKEGSILSGFQAEAIYSRGVHIVDMTGKEEFAIEEQYKEKAKVADENGMFRLADAFRKIANSYHAEGKRIIAEHHQREEFE